LPKFVDQLRNRPPVVIDHLETKPVACKKSSTCQCHVLEAIHESVAVLLSVCGRWTRAQCVNLMSLALLKRKPIKQCKLKKSERSKISQPIFALYLNMSESTVQKWESGTKKSSSMALKLLDIVHKHGIGVLA
jgi:putative transcriptional regulator